MDPSTNDPSAPAASARVAKRTQIIVVAVVFTMLIGFCGVPCVIFGGWSSIEEFLRPAPTAPATEP
jgi:hypothetical protein